MQSDSHDEFMKRLAKMIEDMMKNLPQENTRFLGCTIFTGTPDDLAKFLQMREEDKKIDYEVIESEDQVFITAQIPPDLNSAPYADIKRDSVRIFMDDKEALIELPAPADVIHSFYMVRHGVMDIMVKKLKVPQKMG